MSEHEHVTKHKIAAFAAKTLSAEKHRTVAGHLLRCIECRSLLPLPTTKKFLQVLLEETDEPERREKN